MVLNHAHHPEAYADLAPSAARLLYRMASRQPPSAVEFLSSVVDLGACALCSLPCAASDAQHLCGARR